MAMIGIILFYLLLIILIAAAISLAFIIIGAIIIIVGNIKRKKYKDVPQKKSPSVLIAVGSVFICIPFLAAGTLVTDAIVHRVINEKKLSTAEKCEIIMEAVQNKEKEPIKELFCENAKDNYDLDTELDGFFNFIDGNIVSYDEPKTENVSSSSDENGTDESFNNGYISNILTDTGNVYTISIYTFSVYKKHPNFVGIVTLSIEDQNRYNHENYYPRDAIYKIKIDYPG